MPNIIPQGVGTDRVDKLSLSAGCPVIIYSMVENAMEIKVGELLRTLGLKLAVAESCTGTGRASYYEHARLVRVFFGRRDSLCL